MRLQKIALSMAAVSVLAMPSAVLADEATEMEAPPSTLEALDMDNWPFEVSGEIIGTYGVFSGDGVTHNPKRKADNTAIEHDAGDGTRAELTAKLFLNGDVGEESSWHGELQFNKDWEGVDGYSSTRLYSQFDWLRELYLDTITGDMEWRIGKQQVVWGKADGVKFLDIINPTDFRHWGQDSMEDSRIPLWMVTADYPIGDDGSLQFVYVPQVNVTNQIPGLYDPETGDAGQPFVPLGMDTMLGGYNGFKNIGPQMGMVAGAFTQGFSQLLPNMANPNILQGFSGMTVNQFTNMDGSDPAGGRPDVDQFLQSTIPAGSGYVPGSVPSGVTGNQMLSGITNNDPTNPPELGGPGIGSTTNMMGVSLNTANPTTMFDYMGDTTFATFDTFVGMNTKYVRELEDNDGTNANVGLRYAGATDGGLNYTFNYYYHYDNNPVIDVSWEGTGGQALTAQANAQGFDQLGQPVAPGAGDQAYQTQTMSLKKADGTAYNYSVDGPATMVFTESQNKINTFGLSFDYAIDNSFAPVIVRGEFVYDKGVKQPVVDLGKLAYGDFAGAFTNEEADFVNYVIGLDVTVMTNLFVSFQFMDKWNLDHQDSEVSYAGNTQNYGKFTANSASMSMSNGFRKAEEHQIMYTFFLSKPFMESDVLRVNNLFLYENEDGGYWNRLDFEYSWSDSTILSAAWNQYGGDEYGVFGQFEEMSNVQGSVKFIF